MSQEEHPLTGPSTRSVHAGEDRLKFARSLVNPVAQTATYIFETVEEFAAFKAGEVPSYEYGRYGNPTLAVAEAKIAALEGAAAGLLCASGMSAVTTSLLALLRGGEHLILLGDCYRQTTKFCRLLARFGIAFSQVKAWDWDDLERETRSETRLLFTEAPTNPHLRVVDLKRLSGFTRDHGLVLLVDSTFATPVNLRPLEHGADLVIHSATKYLGGHNDLVAGGVFGAAEGLAPIREFQRVCGNLADPQTAYLLVRGLKTLALRVERQNQTGLALARYLEAHPKVRQVYYPGLASHPDHEVAARQMTGFGGVVSFEIDGDPQRTRAFVNGLRIPYLAPSLGGVESLVTHPATFSYYDLTPQERLAAGIPDQLVRYAAGIEEAEELIADLDQALACL
ncbi:MAG: aminotransferase class I/II-fold pyridoxal phosphate-dependent enzyme [Candidatus Latescibacterota bacterium]